MITFTMIQCLETIYPHIIINAIVVQELVYRYAFMRPVFHFTVTPEYWCRGSSIHHGSPIKDFGDDERENHRMTVTSYMNHYTHTLYADLNISELPKSQHQAYRWTSVDEIEHCSDIHPYSKIFLPNFMLSIKT